MLNSKRGVCVREIVFSGRSGFHVQVLDFNVRLNRVCSRATSETFLSTTFARASLAAPMAPSGLMILMYASPVMIP